MATILKSVRKKKPQQKARTTKSPLDFAAWAKIVGAPPEEVEAAWNDLKCRGLVSVRQGKLNISAEAMVRANTDAQRRLASHLSGYELTDNSYIVRYAGAPPGSPMILDTRIYVEYIANYFRAGWGVTEMLRDLPQLTLEEVEAAIQYYLNHREEIEREIQESIDIYESNLSSTGTNGDMSKVEAKLLFDCMFPAAFAEFMRERKFDVTEARDLPKKIQRNDFALLEKAVQERRVVITCNHRDRKSNFCVIHDEWLRSGKKHFGIILIPQFQIDSRFDRWTIHHRLPELLKARAGMNCRTNFCGCRNNLFKNRRNQDYGYHAQIHSQEEFAKTNTKGEIAVPQWPFNSRFCRLG
jgi:uncharacterized protein (DUF433 family)